MEKSMKVGLIVSIMVILIFSTFVIANFLEDVNGNEQPDVNRSIILINLVGLNWDVIDSNMDKLPKMENMIRNGVEGTVRTNRSVKRYSPIENTALASGYNPDKIMVIDYGGEPQEYMHNEGRLINGDDVAVDRIWDVLKENNLSCTMYRWLLGYPHDDTCKISVSGRLIKGTRKYTPKGKLGGIDFPQNTEYETFLEIDRRVPDRDFQALQFESIHDKSHTYMGCLEPEEYNLPENCMQNLRKEYTEFDRFLEELRSEHPESNIIITGEMSIEPFPNNGIWHGYTDKLFDKLDLPFNIGNWDLTGPGREKLKEHDQLGEVGSYVEAGIPEDTNKTRLTSNLNKIRVKKHEEKFIKDISFDDSSILFRFNFKRSWVDGLYDNISLTLPGNENFILKVKRITGAHSNKIPFIASGPDIKKTNKEIKINISDIAPTIYKIMNIELPKDLDGKPIDRIIEDDVDNLN